MTAVPHQSRGRAVSAPLDLLALLPIPSELASEEGYERTYHLDLASLSRTDLERELIACRLINLIHDSQWHRDREELLEQRLAS